MNKGKLHLLQCLFESSGGIFSGCVLYFLLGLVFLYEAIIPCLPPLSRKRVANNKATVGQKLNDNQGKKPECLLLCPG